jgi:hypothetical protein
MGWEKQRGGRCGVEGMTNPALYESTALFWSASLRLVVTHVWFIRLNFPEKPLWFPVKQKYAIKQPIAEENTMAPG